jgi:hypothetical protein
LRLVQAAFACDLTRVVTLAVGMPPISVSNQHDLCHQTSDKTDGDAHKVRDAQVRYFEQFAKLAELLDGVKESDGSSLLDNTAIVWVGQIANGNHAKTGHKWTVVGSLGGFFRTGQYLNVAGTPHSNLFTSLAQGMGISVDSFGAAEACTGPHLDAMTRHDALAMRDDVKDLTIGELYSVGRPQRGWARKPQCDEPITKPLCTMAVVAISIEGNLTPCTHGVTWCERILQDLRRDLGPLRTWFKFRLDHVTHSNRPLGRGLECPAVPCHGIGVETVVGHRIGHIRKVLAVCFFDIPLARANEQGRPCRDEEKSTRRPPPVARTSR